MGRRHRDGQRHGSGDGRVHLTTLLLNGDIAALEGETVVRFPRDGSLLSALHTIDGIDKLVGTSKSKPEDVLAIVTGPDGRSTPAVLSLPEGSVSPVPVNWNSEEDIRGLAHLEGWDRAYGDIELKVQRVRSRSQESRLH